MKTKMWKHTTVPLIIEVIDDQSKLEPLLPELKRIVGDNGLVSTSEVYVV